MAILYSFLAGHEGAIYCLEGVGNLLASGGDDGVKVWKWDHLLNPSKVSRCRLAVPQYVCEVSGVLKCINLLRIFPGGSSCECISATFFVSLMLVAWFFKSQLSSSYMYTFVGSYVFQKSMVWHMIHRYMYKHYCAWTDYSNPSSPHFVFRQILSTAAVGTILCMHGMFKLPSSR